MEPTKTMTIGLMLLLIGSAVPGLMPAAADATTPAPHDKVLLAPSGGGPVLQFSTIQAAIDAASPGDTIEVPAGTYPEQLVVNTPQLTLLGANAGVHGTSDERGPESTIESRYSITIRADHVTFDGFEITGFFYGVNTRTLSDAFREDITLTNNHIHSETGFNALVFGEYIGDPARSPESAEIKNVTISDNWIDVQRPGHSARGVVFTNHFADITYTDLLIEGNLIESQNQGIFASAATSTFVIDNAQIVGNTFARTASAVNLGNLDADSSIIGNLFEDNQAGALFHWREPGGTVIDNTFQNNSRYGMYLFDDTWFPGPSDSVTLRGNAFADNEVGVINAANNPPIDARFNWWGHITGPLLMGDAIQGSVDVTPWCLEPECLL